MVRSSVEEVWTNDVRYFCRAFGFQEEAGWVFQEWREWFRLLSREVRTVEAVQNELDALTIQGHRFGAGQPFQAADALPRSLADQAWQWFAELVRVPALEEPSLLMARLEEVLNLSELPWSTTLHREIELEIQAPERPVFLRLPVFVEKPVAGGIKLFKIRQVTEEMVAAQVNDILLTFEAAVSHGIFNKEHCIVLFDEPTVRKAKYLSRLENVATLMPLFSDRTPQRLLELFRQK
jgi:hypothetical protein